MREDTITALPDPNGFSADPLTDLIRKGARQLIEQALEAELGALLAEFSNETTPNGHARIVRHGHLPEREVMTGVGPVSVKVPRVRDRGPQAEKVRFTSLILPPYLRKAKSVEELLPWLYLKGLSTGDFQEALAALLGPNAAGLSSTTISRLKADWWDDYERWQRRDLSTRRIVYVWADGVYFQPRMEEKQCILVLIGADEWGRNEILGLTDGYRESTQSWRELLLDLKRRGLNHAPDLAVGDGALGFWAALREVFGETTEQRCWFHKTGNVLNAMPKSVQAKAKGHLHDIWQAETKGEANAAFDFFVETYGVKYEKAVAKLIKDRDVLLAFGDWLHAQRLRVSAKSRLGEKLTYIHRQWGGLQTFLRDGRVEMDSNSIENLIRPIALTRKNALFAGHDEGGRTWARIASLIATAKINGVEPFAYLKATLEAIADGHPASRIDELLPWNFTPSS